jgi:hypothetical protein
LEKGFVENNQCECVSNKSTPTHSGVQIECDPNCTAHEPQHQANESAAARLLRKTVDDPLALSTVALALATMLMALYTAIVARATKAAAEHIPRLERAYVFFRLMENAVGHSDSENNVFDQAVVGFRICNYGKTIAFVKSIDFRLAVLAEAPDNTIHDPQWKGYLLKVDEELNPEVWGADIYLRAADVPDDLRAAYQRGEASVWFYGSLFYDDVMGNRHITRTRFRYIKRFSRFESDGGKPYNETT